MDKRGTPLLSTLLIQKFNSKQERCKSDVRDCRAFLPGKSEGSQVDCLFHLETLYASPFQWVS